MIQTICDNCNKIIMDKPDQVNKDNPEWKPEKTVTLKMHIEGTESYPILMDLCVKCAKKYVTVLSNPLS